VGSQAPSRHLEFNAFNQGATCFYTDLDGVRGGGCEFKIKNIVLDSVLLKHEKTVWDALVYSSGSRCIIRTLEREAFV
jgi:hypothetical protein